MMNTNLGQSALTSKSNNDNLITQNINRSIRAGQKYMQQKQDKITIELQYMRFQQQYRKQVTLWEEQLSELRMEIDRQQEILQQAENKELQQKQQINTLHKENLKLFQQNQKNKKLINTLKTDNQALQLEIERWKSDRKTYSAKLDSIYELKKNMNVQIAQKNSLIEQQQSRIRELQKKLTEYKLKTQELSSSLNEKQRDNKELSFEVKSHLQSYLQTQNIVSRLQHQIHETNELNMTLKEKILQLEKDKQVLLQRIYDLNVNKTDRSQEEGYDEQQNVGYYNNTGGRTKKQQNNKYQSAQLQNIITPADERLMLQIQSFMREFEGLLDRKSQQRHISIQQHDKLINSIECLQKTV